MASRMTQTYVPQNSISAGAPMAVRFLTLVLLCSPIALAGQRTQKPPLHGRHWVAITGKPLAATAGAMTFQKGGNPVDAACAMLAAVTTMWDVLSWGGETQALIYNPQTRKVIAINALGVDRDDLPGLRVVDERLGFAAPGEHVPHCGDGGEHGARRVDGVAALLERHGAGGGGERLAGDRDPVAPVQGGLLGALTGERDRRTEENEREETNGHRCSG